MARQLLWHTMENVDTKPFASGLPSWARQLAFGLAYALTLAAMWWLLNAVIKSI